MNSDQNSFHWEGASSPVVAGLSSARKMVMAAPAAQSVPASGTQCNISGLTSGNYTMSVAAIGPVSRSGEATITVSIGCSVLTENDTPSGAFGRADKAVYYAKGNGRNQVRSYQELVLSGELVEQVSEAMDVDLF